ncbi:hypothetical protein SUGI_0498000 [Cryptomeria japonica]|uniref:uncharacterized protein LOC131062249 isoform X2 n=1 Tax=Cryptomeria japonica TaxID=3369 RepID=UPI0024089779|nr:uncharacterized protein LOC131062249 isoform X2 [Cryptomeria japonica]GLJ25969.1 hypothetical protein SUGI_0498000 [Cryptomeria japonica]
MASLERLFRQAGRACTKLHLGTRTPYLFQHFPYCSSSSSSFPEEDASPSSDPSSIRVVSYAPKPKNPNAENTNAEDPNTNQSRTTAAANIDFTPPGQRGDSISRPWSREDSRYLKDSPSIPIVSYGLKVAPLPEDKGAVREQENVEGVKEMGEVIEGTVQEEESNIEEVKEKGEVIKEAVRDLGGGQKGQLEREGSRLRQHMFAMRQEVNIPYPKLLPPEKKKPKVLYDLNEAIKQVKANVKCKFDETVEAHVLLSVNAKRSDQMVRGGIALPHGIGKTVRVAVFADGAAANEARAAGADVVGGDELINEIKEVGLKGNFDKCIATPAFMPRLGKIGKVLGPRGLMPNPKAGTVTNDVAEAIREAKKGRVDFKMDKTAIVHVGLGKASFKEEALRENIVAFLNALLAAKPVGLKKTSRYAGYLKTFTLTSTMGPGFRVSVQSLSNVTDQYMKLRV